MVILIIILWLLIGWKSFVYWWTKDFDYTTNNIPMSVLASLLGPFALFIGWLVHGDTKTLFRRRVLKKKRRGE